MLKKSLIVPNLAIELTQRCNLNCAHCYKGDSKNVDISKKVVDRIFDEVAYVGSLHLSGGEVFLAYEQLKMVLEKAKEKNVIIKNCSMIINGTIYDERIYNLLDEYFTGDGKTYHVAISLDKYHNASIDQIYNNNKESDNRELHPGSRDDVLSNFHKHYSKPSFLQFERVSKHLISNGRAVKLNEPSKPFEVEGYFYSYASNLNTFSVMLVGPTVFVSADGWLSDINSEIERREEQSLGNILEQSISHLVESGGIRIYCNSIEDFFEWSVRREYDFLTHKEPHYVFENGVMRLIRVSMMDNKYSPPNNGR